MPDSRRTLLVAAALAVLLAGTGCTSSSPGSATSASPGASTSTSTSTGTGTSTGTSGGSSPGGQERRDAQAGPRWDTSPSSVAALGDSITRAYDACGLLADCPESSWATGTDPDVDSLALRLLRGRQAVTGHAWNLAENGATVADLPGQAREAVAHEPELVTILVGANDACAADVSSMTSVQRFEEDVAEALDILRSELPGTQVYVASVPDLMRLWEVGSGSATASAVWGLADICPSMLRDAKDDSDGATERREAVRERVRQYNAVLAETCEADALCRYDGGAVFRYPFTDAQLSDWDWFHPSEQGQQELARLAYERVTRETDPHH